MMPLPLRHSATIALAAALLAIRPPAGASAQTPIQPQFATGAQPARAEPAMDPSRTATVAGTQVGQRQVDPLADPDLPDPYARIANRVQNRVQNRLSNRMDPSYRPRTAAADPFKAATAEPETGKGKRPR